MDLTAWLHQNRLGLRSRPPTSAGNTKGSRSDALAPDSTTGLMPPSPPSLTPSETPNGPAAPSLRSAIEYLTIAVSDLMEDSGMNWRGRLAPAYEWLDATPAPDAEPAPSSASTSAKQDSPPSAPALTFVRSGSPVWDVFRHPIEGPIHVYVQGADFDFHVPDGTALLIRSHNLDADLKSGLSFVTVERGTVSQ